VGGFATPVKVAPGEPSRSRFRGTSAAAPHAAGCAALALQARGPQTTVRELVQKLTATARDLGTPGPDAITGFGLVDCDAASRQ
jgi:subtilisin family serine protease